MKCRECIFNTYSVTKKESQYGYQKHNGFLFNIFMLVVKLGTVMTTPHHLSKCKTHKSEFYCYKNVNELNGMKVLQDICLCVYQPLG